MDTSAVWLLSSPTAAKQQLQKLLWLLVFFTPKFVCKDHSWLCTPLTLSTITTKALDPDFFAFFSEQIYPV